MTISMTSFLNHVFNIVCNSPNKQMGGINARWDVALMKDAEPFWYRVSVNLPRNAMRKFCDRAISSDGQSPVGESSLRLCSKGTLPFPACWRFFYELPKTLLNRFSAKSVIARMAMRNPVGINRVRACRAFFTIPHYSIFHVSL